MHIRRNFYDEAKADLEQSEQRPLPAKITHRQSEPLESVLQRLEKTCKRVPNPDKHTAFEALARRALDLAKFLCANIKIDTTETDVGFIVLESDVFMLDGMDSREYAQTVADLFTTADDIFFFVPDHELPEITFTFLLYDCV